MKKILVMEDESNIRSFVVINLRRSGYEPIEAATGTEALEKVKANPDICLALLDVMLPDIDGFEVCRRIRASGSKMGIIMLTAKSQEIDKVTGLMTGADDYVTKPFSPAELTARVDALVRRLGSDEDDSSNNELVSGPFVLNPRNRTLEKDGQRLKLTQIEYLLMKLFMENPGKALSREEILDTVWGRDYFGELKIVDVNVRRLRLLLHFMDSAHHRFYAGQNFPRAERLGHIIVRTGHQSRDLIHLLRACGQHNDTDLVVGHPDAAADLKPVDAGEHDVAQGNINIGVGAK